MSQLSSTLAQASHRNQELLAILSQTDHAPSAVKQNASYISDLQQQVGMVGRELKKLHEITEDERKDHIKYRDSTVKRFAHKLGGHKGKEKFANRQEKEEREFLQAWQEEREANERREELERALEIARNDKLTLENDTKRHDQAQRELDQMYNSIFSGPTPDVPEEDQMENAVNSSRDWFQQCQTLTNTEKHALDALTAADRQMANAQGNMDSALSASTMDMWGGGTFTDMMERNSLSQAQNSITQALYHMSEASRAQPDIRPLSQVNIDNGHMVSDVLFDNIFTDTAQHDRIKSADAQLKRAILELRQQISEQQRRVRDAEAQSKQASQNLEDARGELQRIRGEAFERLAGGNYQGEYNGGYTNEAPPSYS